MRDSAGWHRRLYAIAGLGAARGRLSTIQVVTFYRRQSVVMRHGDGAAGAAVRPVAGLSQMTSTAREALRHCAAVHPEPQHRRCEEEVQSAINADKVIARESAGAPGYSKTNPPTAGADAGHHFRFRAVAASEDLWIRAAPKLSQLNGVGLVSISGAEPACAFVPTRGAASYASISRIFGPR